MSSRCTCCSYEHLFWHQWSLLVTGLYMVVDLHNISWIYFEYSIMCCLLSQNTGYILWKCSKMKNLPLKYTHTHKSCITSDLKETKGPHRSFIQGFNIFLRIPFLWFQDYFNFAGRSLLSVILLPLDTSVNLPESCQICSFSGYTVYTFTSTLSSS